MSIVTRTGDSGETGLLYGGRVAKDDARIEAAGALDEAVSTLGLARALSAGAPLAARLEDLQRELFTVGAELATARGERASLEKHFPTVSAAMVDELERQTHELEAAHPVRTFVLPGGTAAAAAVDMARSQVRRCERRAVALRRAGELENPEVVRYLNRLSDLLFMLARHAEQGATIEK